MKDIAQRLREIREFLGVSRKEVEIRSQGAIKSASLSSFENAQSQISIMYLKQLIIFYQNEGVEVGFDWIITGNGAGPTENSTLEKNLSVIKEISLFRKMNSSAIIHTATKDHLLSNILQGDIIGGVRVLRPFERTKNCLIRLNDGETKIGFVRDNNNQLIFIDQNHSQINYLPIERIEGLYEIVWIRKFL